MLKSTLLSARSHLRSKLSANRNNPLHAAENLVDQISLDCIEHCIQEMEQAEATARLNREFEAGILRAMSERRSTYGPQNNGRADRL